MSSAASKQLMSSDGDVKVIQKALSDGADINVRDGSGRTALMVAALNGSISAIHLLIKNGAEISATDASGRTALHHATDLIRANYTAYPRFGGMAGMYHSGDAGIHPVDIGKLLSVFAEVAKPVIDTRDAQRKAITDLQTKLETSTRRIEGLEREINQSANQHAQRVAQFEATINGLKSAAAQSQAQHEQRVTEMEATIKRLKDEMTAAGQEAASCRDAAEGLRRQLAGDAMVVLSAADAGTNYPAIADDDVSDLDTATLEACVASLQSALDEAQALHDRLPDPSSSIPTYSYSLQVAKEGAGINVLENKKMDSYSLVWSKAIANSFISEKWSSYFLDTHAPKLKNMRLAVSWPDNNLTADALKVCIEQIRVAKEAAEAVESAKVARIATSAARHIRSLLKPLLSILIDRRLNDVCAAFAAACACNGVLVPAAAEAMRALGVGTTVSFTAAV